jgi:cytochrome b561
MREMPAFSTRTRFGWVAQAFHWATAILVLVAYVFGEGGPGVFSEANRSTLTLHQTAGSLVLVLLVLRLIWRIFDGRPESAPSARWMVVLSRIVHIVLFLLLAGLPISGIAGTFNSGHPLNILGLGAFGPPGGGSTEVGEQILEVHELMGNLILYIAGLHAVAALFHHFVLRDRTLLAMLPGTRV